MLPTDMFAPGWALSAKGTHSNDNIWDISIPGKHFQSTDCFFIANNITEFRWPIFLNPVKIEKYYILTTFYDTSINTV